MVSRDPWMGLIIMRSLRVLWSDSVVSVHCVFFSENVIHSWREWPALIFINWVHFQYPINETYLFLNKLYIYIFIRINAVI